MARHTAELMDGADTQKKALFAQKYCFAKAFGISNISVDLEKKRCFAIVTHFCNWIFGLFQIYYFDVIIKHLLIKDVLPLPIIKIGPTVSE